MALYVQKYGGTSVGDIERIRNVARRIARTRQQGHDVIAVVSAMAGETDRLLGLGRELSERPVEREMDVLVSSGEQVSAALLCIALNQMGVKAMSLMGHQARVETDSVHTKARITRVDDERLRRAIEGGHAVVVAGFQGIDEHGNITTLGRGGSDTSAVAIAAAARADVCEIYTDVEGVFTTDPNVCRSARKIERISYEEMLELSALGAKVLQIRSVELAMKYAVPIHVRSSFSDAEGTMVTGEDESLESVVVAGVTSDKKAAKVTVLGVPDQPGVVAGVFEPLAEQNISVDMIIQNVATDGTTDLTFTVTRDDLERTRDMADGLAKKVGARDFTVDPDVVKVSIVGLGMRSHAGVAAKMFRLLADEGINIEAISTSEIKTSCLIRAKYAELAVRVLHDGFGLGDR
ncbi:MAG TPA: aspartate kinase [Polyangiaceae bacterium LLY-WYZ-15_(1-7)]|nr:aspartate kinase [Sandaracinus sp.]HJK90240.1 aspartate kinase [Polyangiaceae bacterium LLY-WYZ-15_(1-7)]HJL06209.1 aspartate kinase [Polyangiaceae bacterium LLY-WYZ-15_(1-7)]HJL10896.1 aspartate kinase [Polyangiaceae bacterium LLY-WYZ-15_(1-7)]HJL27181.1 aspartate kinase [Polyangiaceae bacterium LLY-WYZ-15_(1-7)]